MPPNRPLCPRAKSAASHPQRFTHGAPEEFNLLRHESGGSRRSTLAAASRKFACNEESGVAMANNTGAMG
jgi:hypothetical protein